MPIKKIVKTVVYAETGTPLQVGPMALTKQATGTFDGEAVANLSHLATGRGAWSKKVAYAPTVLINGVVSGCVVSGGASTNNLEVTAGVANVNGTVVAVGADTSNAITRGASAKYAVHALCVSAAGTLSVVKGDDGDALDLTGGYGGAGQKPLVATNLAVLGYAVTLGDSAAAIPLSDIYAGESANVPYQIDYVRGGIVLYSALELNHTGGVSRAVYATFYDLTTAISPIAELEEAILTISKAAPIQNVRAARNFRSFTPITDIGWKLDAKKGRTDDYWVEKMIDPNADEYYLKMIETTGDTKAWYGFGILSGDMPISSTKGPSNEGMNFTGNEELIHV